MIRQCRGYAGDIVRFPLRRGVPGRIFLAPLCPRQPYVELTGDSVRVRMGALGGADLPLEKISRVGRMSWPWWGGLGVRLGGKGLVAYVAQSGPTAVIDLSEPTKVWMPLPWTSRRVAIAVEDLEGFLASLAAQKVIVDFGAEKGSEDTN
jgi:hypothetical protein